MLDNNHNALRRKINVFSRSKTFTPAGILLINRLRDEGRSPAEIAEKLGCALGTLRVRCSQLGISLRQQKHTKWRTLPDVLQRERGEELTIALSARAIDQLRRRAASIGWTEARLVSELLKVIAQDDLYDAVLDERKQHVCEAEDTPRPDLI
jgi:hypothetical protein